MEQSFKERVRYIVRKVGSIKKLAQLANVSPRVVGKYLAGESDPSRKRLISLADAADVSVEWLATGVGATGRRLNNISALDYVISEVEKTFVKRDVSLSPRKKAELIMLLYEEIAEDESKKDSLESRIMRLVRFAGGVR